MSSQDKQQNISSFFATKTDQQAAPHQNYTVQKCHLCLKKFKAEHFLQKHILNKHSQSEGGGAKTEAAPGQ